MLTHLLHTAQDLVLAAPPTPSTPPPANPVSDGVNTQGIVTFFATQIAPVLLAVLGVVFIGRAGRGQVSKVITSGGIAVVGLAFIAGAATLFFVGEYLVGLAFG